MHNIKPLAQATPAEVRAMAQAAALRDEPLDQCNVFPIGTGQHTLFTNEYLARTFELEGFDTGAITAFNEILVLDIPCHAAGQCADGVNQRAFTHG